MVSERLNGDSKRQSMISEDTSLPIPVSAKSAIENLRKENLFLGKKDAILDALWNMR